MKEILSELNEGNSVLLETEKLEDFLKYSFDQPDFHSYSFEYSEGLVKITMTEKIVKSKK